MRGVTVTAAATLLAFSLACSGDTDHTPEGPAVGTVPAPVEAKAPAAAAVTYTLTGLENGDAACYVDVTTASGETKNLPGDFELCAGGGHDATAMIGKSVVLTTEPSSVLAASCQGDPACKDTTKVDLVVSIKAL